jgi:hypothetical protein
MLALRIGATVGFLGLGTVLAAAGCGSSSSATKLPTSPGGMTTSVDRSRCDEKGKQLVASDINGDKRPDVLKLFVTGAGGEQRLVCKQVDMNNDSKIDIVYHYDDTGRLAFEEFDLDFDGRFDMRAFYQGGRKVREEVETNYDNRADLIKYYEADKLVRIEIDGNNDGRVDEWQYYDQGKLDRIGYDTSGSGRVDRWERGPEAEGGAAEPPGGTSSTGPVPPAGPGPAGAPPAAAPAAPPAQAPAK